MWRLSATKETFLGRIVDMVTDLSPSFLRACFSLSSFGLFPFSSFSTPSSFLPSFPLALIYYLRYIAFSFSLWTIKVQGREKRGTGDPWSFHASSDFINGKFKRSQKNLFSFSCYWIGEAHLRWPADPREALLSNYLLIHWLNGMERRNIKHGDSLSTESFETPSRHVQ